jgi:hypothetical protein
VDDLPADLLERWRSADGHYRVAINPKENLNDNGALRRFVNEVRTVAPAQATGAPVMYFESGNTIVTAFKEAFVYAMGVIVALLFVVMHKKIDVLLGLAPLLLAGLLTGAASVILGMPFNYANIIAVPLFLSMGIDSGIHILHRYRTDPPVDGLVLKTATAKAVALSTLTSVFGFGNLAVSPHWGTASMGITLALGNFLTLLCTFIVLPSILALLKGKLTTPAESKSKTSTYVEVATVPRQAHTGKKPRPHTSKATEVKAIKSQL